eukprot:scaffold24528_cov18-Tisochrysis_lutea.AAC.3
MRGMVVSREGRWDAAQRQSKGRTNCSTGALRKTDEMHHWGSRRSGDLQHRSDKRGRRTAAQ